MCSADSIPDVAFRLQRDDEIAVAPVMNPIVPTRTHSEAAASGGKFARARVTRFNCDSLDLSKTLKNLLFESSQIPFPGPLEQELLYLSENKFPIFGKSTVLDFPGSSVPAFVAVLVVPDQSSVVLNPETENQKKDLEFFSIGFQ